MSDTIVNESAMRTIELNRKYGQRIAVITGWFDILNAGHLHIIDETAKISDMIIIGISTDAAISRADDGASGPALLLAKRIRLLNMISLVDLVIPFDNDTPEKFIREIKPAILAIGSEYKTMSDKIPGVKFVEESGGKVCVVEMLDYFVC